MKTRDGFVSNSSSSSFVIALDEKPKNIKELRFCMWLWEDLIEKKDFDISVKTDTVTKRILNDIRKSKPTTKWKDIYDVMNKGVCYNELMPDSDDFKSYKEYEKRYKETSKIVAKTFMLNNRKKNVYILEYGDNVTDLESYIEHGGVFDRIRHLWISHH